MLIQKVKTMANIDGKKLLKYAQAMFQTENITAVQLDYVLTMLDPVAYALKYHTTRGHPLTFSIPNYNYAEANKHRPFQKKILKAITDKNIKEVDVIKARQLGLTM